MTIDLRSFAAQVRVTDGVYGTELQVKGLVEPGGCNELLNADNAINHAETLRPMLEGHSAMIERMHSSSPSAKVNWFEETGT